MVCKLQLLVDRDVEACSTDSAIVVVTFDLFGTLVSVPRPAAPATAIRDALSAEGLSVPGGFETAYCEPQIECPPEREIPTAEHVRSVLNHCGVTASIDTCRRAVRTAFSVSPTIRPDAHQVVTRAAESGPVGLCSNCSVEGLVEETVSNTPFEDSFDAIVTSVGCGWRKPHRRIFEAIADQLGVTTAELTHVGDDPSTDGGVVAVGGTFLDCRQQPLATLPVERT